MIWTPEDIAREQVRRQAAGMTAQQVQRAVDTAVVRVRETLEELRSPAPRGEFAADPQELADRWAALLTEWRRVAAHLAASAGVYDGDLDKTGCAWAREREERRTTALRDHAARMQRRQDERDELSAEVWVGAAAGRRVRAVAARTGLTPHEVLAQLAERVSVDDDGAVSVTRFTPGRTAVTSEER